MPRTHRTHPRVRRKRISVPRCRKPSCQKRCNQCLALGLFDETNQQVTFSVANQNPICIHYLHVPRSCRAPCTARWRWANPSASLPWKAWSADGPEGVTFRPAFLTHSPRSPFPSLSFLPSWRPGFHHCHLSVIFHRKARPFTPTPSWHGHPTGTPPRLRSTPSCLSARSPFRIVTGYPITGYAILPCARLRNSGPPTTSPYFKNARQPCKAASQTTARSRRSRNPCFSAISGCHALVILGRRAERVRRPPP